MPYSSLLCTLYIISIHYIIEEMKKVSASCYFFILHLRIAYGGEQCRSKKLRFSSLTGFALCRYKLKKVPASCHFFILHLQIAYGDEQCRSKNLGFSSLTGFALCRYKLKKVSASCHFFILYLRTAHCYSCTILLK